MPTGAALAISGLTKRFQTGDQEIVAADDCIVDIAGGSCTAITGPSGSGKSTLLNSSAPSMHRTTARSCSTESR
ncbi:ATP-binding cassette domain-containing protein [Dactylosporangium sp. AC04546]|uniref:ATP-binding cassette domain-containing protein n=1 Tax=Dactylosporangium sp. AC04546 TaxID=2862460 RepID=UPI003FA44036